MIVQSFKKQIHERLIKGLTQTQIALELGCAKATVNYHFKRLGFESDANKFAKNHQLQREIKEAYAELKSTYKVAERLGISRSTVARYVNIETVEKLDENTLTQNRIQAVVDWRRRSKSKLVEYKGGKCKECGYNKSINALHFHHLDPSQKDFSISGKSWSFDKLKVEVDKCVLLCANCHAEVHEGLRVLE